MKVTDSPGTSVQKTVGIIMFLILLVLLNFPHGWGTPV